MESLLSHWREEIARKTLRDFGFIMAIAFGIFGTVPVLRHAPFRLWTAIVVELFVWSVVLRPGILSPFYRLWMTFGAVMGYINLRLILGIVFFVLLTPIACLLRLLKKDILGLKFHRDWETYRKPSQPTAAFQRQF